MTFSPASAGAVTGTLTISSNSTTKPSVAVSLSGTGTWVVDLTWDAPTISSDPVAGYNIYRATGSSTYQFDLLPISFSWEQTNGLM